MGALSLTKPGVYGRIWGPTLSVIYSAESVASRPTTRPAALLPLLVILFVVSYCILTMLVFEQGQTIESQHGLIREMLKDSAQLAALKSKMAREDSKRPHDKGAVQADHSVDAGNPGAAKGSNETKRPGKSARVTKEVPGKPAADLEDVRRFTRVI
jgi:hypothetical protein